MTILGDPKTNHSKTYQDFCGNPRIDAATTNSNGDTFIFIGKDKVYFIQFLPIKEMFGKYDLLLMITIFLSGPQRWQFQNHPQ